MPTARLRETFINKALFTLVAVFAFVQLTPYLMDNYHLIVALRPLYRAVYDNNQEVIAGLCTDWEVEASSRWTAAQRLILGGLLRSVGCLDLAASTLPEFTTTWDRSEILAYQEGLVAWAQGDVPHAIAIWHRVRGVDQQLLFQARQLRSSDIENSQRWYEAAIMSANSTQSFANAIATYTTEVRQLTGPAAFGEGLIRLEAFFGSDTAAGYRLRGQHSLMIGSYQAASEQLARAISLGMDDAETWYLLGDASWGLNDLATAEMAYRQSVDASIQISWRRPWHFDRLATLLAKAGRPIEALPLQEEAVRLDDYYYYTDNLAVLYAQLEEQGKADLLCRRARQLTGPTLQVSLRCERP